MITHKKRKKIILLLSCLGKQNMKKPPTILQANLFIFFYKKFSKVVVSDPNLLSSIAEVLNALILQCEPLRDHALIVVLKSVELWARTTFSHLCGCRCKCEYICWCGYNEHAGKSASDSRQPTLQETQHESICASFMQFPFTNWSANCRIKHQATTN